MVRPTSLVVRRGTIYDLAGGTTYVAVGTTYLMPAFEVLGTLQISLVRMLGDITRFLVLFTLVRRNHD